MIRHIVFLRHGKAQAEGADKERQLTKLGIEQIKASALRLKSKGFCPNIIISSPLKRAFESAIIASKMLGGEAGGGYGEGCGEGGEAGEGSGGSCGEGCEGCGEAGSSKVGGCGEGCEVSEAGEAGGCGGEGCEGCGEAGEGRSSESGSGGGIKILTASAIARQDYKEFMALLEAALSKYNKLLFVGHIPLFELIPQKLSGASVNMRPGSFAWLQLSEIKADKLEGWRLEENFLPNLPLP